MKKRQVMIFLSLCIVLLGSCSKGTVEDTIDGLTPDIETPEEEENILGSLTAKVNETDFNATRSIVGPYLGASVSILDNGYLLNIFAVDLQLSANRAQTIVLYVAGFDFDTLKADSKFDSPNPFSIVGLEPGAYAIYAEDLNTDDEVDGEGTHTIEGLSIKITAIDLEKQLISGEFSFNGTAEDTTTMFEITDGIFTDVTYELQ